MSTFTEKNARRKNGKNNGSANDRKHAKQLRKQVLGKFGTEDETFQSQCYAGTSVKAGN